MLALLVFANFFTGEDEGGLLIVHTYCGYLIGLLLIARVAWGVAGNRHARFGDFLKPWSETREYLRQLLRPSPPRYVGHNPLGGWMIDQTRFENVGDRHEEHEEGYDEEDEEDPRKRCHDDD